MVALTIGVDRQHMSGRVKIEIVRIAKSVGVDIERFPFGRESHNAAGAGMLDRRDGGGYLFG